MNTKSRTKATELLSTGIAILLSFSSMHSLAWAGPGSTGGGLSDANGDLLDFGETSNSKVKVFKPTESAAFKEVLKPLLEKVNAKLPGAASDLLVGLPPNMEWYLADLPIANSSDECKLYKEDSFQIAKQVDGEVGLSKSWMDNHDKLQQAGLILHELIIFRLDKAPNDCSTRVRRAVRAVFHVDQLSEAQLQAELARVGIYEKTKTQAQRILELSNELIQSQCGAGSSTSVPMFDPGRAYTPDPRAHELYTITNDTRNSGSQPEIHSTAVFGAPSSQDPLSEIHWIADFGGPNSQNPSGGIGNPCDEFKTVVTAYSQKLSIPEIQ